MEAPSKSKKSKSSSKSSGKRSSGKSKSKKSSSKSGVRTKFLIESLRHEYYDLKSDNERLRDLVKANLPPAAAHGILAECYDPNAPKEKINNIDDLARKMAGSGVDDEDDDDDEDMGF